MSNSKLTLEQNIVKYLAEQGYITHVGDVTRALVDKLYAEKLITATGVHGLKDDIESGIESGEIEIDGITGECDHEALTNEEIQEVFDNDEEKSSNK